MSGQLSSTVLTTIVLLGVIHGRLSIVFGQLSCSRPSWCGRVRPIVRLQPESLQPAHSVQRKCEDAWFARKPQHTMPEFVIPLWQPGHVQQPLQQPQVVPRVHSQLDNGRHPLLQCIPTWINTVFVTSEGIMRVSSTTGARPEHVKG